MKFKLKIIMLAFMLLTISSYAQDDDQPPEPEQPDIPPPAAPINEQLVWAALAGIGYVSYTLVKKKQ